MNHVIAWFKNLPDWLFLSLLSLLLFYAGIGSWPFFDADEGRYAAIPRQMLVNGDFVTPTQNYIKFFDKPPLLYWCVAIFYRVFGYHEWAARMVPAGAATLGLVMAFLLARNMFGPRAARLTAMVLATSFLWTVMARVVVTDLLFSAMAFSALASWWLGVAGEKKHRYLFWAFLALAVLSKGPLAVVLVFGGIAIYVAVCRQWNTVGRMQWLAGIPLFFAIAAPWFVLVASRNPEFNYYYWYDQHILRFLGKSISGPDHIEGPFYYLKLLPLVLFPWSFFIPIAVADGWARLRGGFLAHKSVVYLMSAGGFLLLFFNASSSKLVTYVLPLVPIFAILMGAFFDRQLARLNPPSRSWNVTAGLLAALLALLSVLAWTRGQKRLHEMEVSGPYLAIICLALGLWAVGLLWGLYRRERRLVIVANGGGFTLFLLGAISLLAAAAPNFTTPSLIAYIRPGLNAGAGLDTIPYTQSVEFYAGQRVKMLGGSSELEWGLRHMDPAERDQWYTEGLDRETTIDHFTKDLEAEKPVYFFVRKSKRSGKLLAKFDRPEYAFRPVRIIENQRFCVYANNAAAKLTPPATGNQAEPFSAWAAR